MMHQLQDKDKMLAAMKEETAVAREQCKQLTQVHTSKGISGEMKEYGQNNSCGTLVMSSVAILMRSV